MVCPTSMIAYMPQSAKDDPDDPDRKVRTVRWTREVDDMLVQMSHEDGFTYKGRTHDNEWLEKLVRAEKLRRKLAAGEPLSNDEQTMLEAENLADQARKFYNNVREQARKKK